MAATQHNRPYDPAEVENIRHMLEAEAKEGKPIAFDVKVDGMTRIHKTDRVERFNELYNFINENTTDLVISIYPDHTNRKEWYKYAFGESAEGLNGVEVEHKINERMQLFEERHAAKRTEEKLKAAQDDLREAEDYIRILEEKLEAAKTKPNHFGEWDLGKLGSSIIQGVATHHPKILDKVPVLNGIAKVIQEDLKTKPPQQSDSFQGEVSFRPRQVKPALSPEAQAHENTVRQLADFISERFDEHQRRLLGHVILELGEKPDQLPTVAELLNVDVNAPLEEGEEGSED